MVRPSRTIYKQPVVIEGVPSVESATVPSVPSVPLEELTQQAQKIIYETETVFPFVLFPDKVVIRTHHIDIVHNMFFATGTSQRLQYSDIREVLVSYVPFFGSLEIVPMGPPDIFIKVNFLKKAEALRAKRVIVGLIECHRQKVDLSGYPHAELMAHLEEIGKTQG
jgi:hypothetical protein